MQNIFCMNPNINTTFERSVQNNFVVICHTMIIEKGKQRKMQCENVATATSLVRIFIKLQLCECMASTCLNIFMQGTDKSRYVLKVEKNNSCHGNFCFFTIQYILFNFQWNKTSAAVTYLPPIEL